MRKKITRMQVMRLGSQNPCGLCLHLENGRTGIPKTCIHDYECWHCPFDQWIEETEEREQTQGSLKIQREILARAA